MRRGRRPHPELLTPREQEVLACLRWGLSNAEIASRLAISLDGVKYHVSEILAKLEVDSRQEAAAWRGDPTAPRFGAGVLRGFTGLLGRVSVAKASAVAVLGAACIGLALLAFGVFSMDRREAKLGKIAYIYEGDVWVKELPDGEAKRLTNTGQTRSPQWSGDGEWLIYLDVGSAHLIKADGTGERVIGPSYMESLSWSPVGAKYVYYGDEGMIVETPAGGDRYNLPSGNGTRHWTLQSWPIWSPDGEWIAFVRDERFPQDDGFTIQGDYGLWGARSDLTDAREVYRHDVLEDRGPRPMQQPIIPVGWSDDSSTIYFAPRVTTSTERTTELYAVTITRGTVQRTGLNAFVRQDDFPGVRTYEDYFAPSEDGVVVVSGQGSQHWTDRRLTLVLTNGKVRELTAKGSVAISPDMSPRGELAYVMQPDMGHLWAFDDIQFDPYVIARDVAYTAREQRRIWVTDRSGNKAKRLTEESLPEERPQWSADSRHILYASPGSGESLLQPATLRLFSLSKRTSEAIATIDTFADVTGDLYYAPDIIPIDLYGHRNWEAVFDWWQPPLD